MKKLRGAFWSKSKDIIQWCDDEELRVLRQMAGKEMEDRLAKITQKFDDSEENQKQNARQKTRKRAMRL